ncbi:MAG: class I SAM-dependent methyltransferase [Candidatus Nanoarchaeia archaeon]|nr:class I SAM-dependent methyltransferase [Candidatus Nanoarchaeia archaeon]
MSMTKPSAVNKKLSEEFPHDYIDDRIKTAIKLCEKNSNAKYLDVGCSNGRVALEIAKTIGTNDIYGVDIANVEDAKKRGLKAFNVDLNEDIKLPFEDKTFDVVTCFDTIEHVYNTDHVVREIKRILKDNGYAIIIVPRTDSLINIILLTLGYQMMTADCSLEKSYGHFSENRLSGHMAHFTKKAIKDMIIHNGFKIKKYTEASTMGAFLGDQEALGHKVNPIKKLMVKTYQLLPFKKEACVLKITK